MLAGSTAIFGPVTGFKGSTFVSSGFSTEGGTLTFLCPQYLIDILSLRIGNHCLSCQFCRKHWKDRAIELNAGAVIGPNPAISLPLSPSLSLCLSVSVFVCLSLSLVLSVSLCLSVSVFLSLSLCVSVFVSVCLSVCLSVSLSSRIPPPPSNSPPQPSRLPCPKSFALPARCCRRL